MTERTVAPAPLVFFLGFSAIRSAYLVWLWWTIVPDPRRIWDPVWIGVETLPLVALALALCWRLGAGPRASAGGAARSALVVGAALHLGLLDRVARLFPGEIAPLIVQIGGALAVAVAVGALVRRAERR